MNKRYLPFALAASVYEVDPSFYGKIGVKVILCDLDNTLACYRDPLPSEEAKALVRRLQNAGLRFYIASNNTSARVRRYSQALGVEALSGLGKPFSHKLKKLLAHEGFRKDETLLVGDQLLTDVLSANGAGIRVLLCDPLTKQDPLWTRINRLAEKRKRRIIAEKKLAPSWKELSR